MPETLLIPGHNLTKECMSEYVGFKISRGLRSLEIYHFKNDQLDSVSRVVPIPGLSQGKRRKMFREHLSDYKVQIPNNLKPQKVEK